MQKHLPQIYFKEKNFNLLHGDCLNVLKEFKSDFFDMVFADPPYFLSNGGFSVHAGKRVSVNKGRWDASNGVTDDFDFHLQWIQEIRRVLKPEGTLWISGTYHSIYQCGYALQLTDYKILNEIAWFKPNASPNLSCRYFTASHETLIWARKDKKAKHYFNYDLMKNGFWNGDFLKKNNTQMRSVWAISPPKSDEKTFGKHPTQKPLELLNRIILSCSGENAKILDPFCGSATTGIASLHAGDNRQFWGIEVDQKYLDLSIQRYHQAVEQKEEVLL